MSPDLQEVIENAYRLFARYDLRGGVSVCRCDVCVDAETEGALNKVPLREMPSRLLARYTSSAHDWNAKVENDFRHYLPRYFELIASGDAPSDTDEETCLWRLGESGYRDDWGPQEAGAVDRFFATLLLQRLATPLDLDAMGWAGCDRDTVETALCMIAYADGDLAALLSIWDGERGRNATLHLANVIASADWQKRRLRSSYWVGHRGPRPEAAMNQLIQWLLRRDTRERLEGACLVERDEGAAALLSHAEGLVGGMI